MLRAYQWWWNNRHGTFERGFVEAKDLGEAYAVVKQVMGDGDTSVCELPMCTREQYQKQRKEGYE